MSPGFELAHLSIRILATLGLVWSIGSALYAASLGGRSAPADRTARRTGVVALVAALVGLSLLAAVTLLAIGGDWAGAVDPYTVQLYLETNGISLGMRLAGLALLGVWLAQGSRVAAVGAAVILSASFAFSGHVVSHDPRPVLQLAIGLHVIAASFWLGSLAPLAAAARQDTPDIAAQLMDAFARRAATGLIVLVLAGGALAGLLSAQWPWLWLGTDWGRGLLVKLSLVGILIGFAALHRFLLTDRLRGGRAGAGAVLSGSILAEAIVGIAVIAATASFAARYSPGGV
ncbi:MAG: CopD family protein [Alphaproteobacteria bacterium]|nr:CopD family protein [Alphaproteobacteria bacterium]